MSRVISFLTFREKGEEAVRLYTSLIPNSRIHSITVSDGSGLFPRGALQHAAFELDGQQFMAMDGGPHFKFEEGFSIFISCETQQEIDRLWNALAAEGEEQMCGWVKDQYGVSWQIVPPILGELLTGEDAGKAKRVADALLQMRKIEIRALQEAYAG